MGQIGSQYTANYITIKDTDDGSVEQNLPFSPNELGNPMITGAVNVSTTAEWDLKDAKISSKSDSKVVVSYDAAGTYTAGLSLKNMWGSDNKTVDIVVVPFPEGIEDSEVEMMGVYPNPFTDFVNLSFAKEGEYTIQIVALDGKLIESKKANVSTNEVVRLDVNGEKGMYIVKVLNANGTAVRTLKVVKN